MRAFFEIRGIVPAQQATDAVEEPLVDLDATLDDGQPAAAAAGESGDGDESLLAELGDDEDDEKLTDVLSNLSIMQRMKLAMKGTREQRARLVRDSNKLVSAAVLSSPKLTETEVEAFTRMGNVSEDVLRIISMNRSWMKNYGVMLGLAKHPKSPPAISMPIVARLNEKDQKALSVDRNVPEGVRLAARKFVVKAMK
jgi:hypothetical protein